MYIVTISNWFNAWEELNLVGLYDRKGRGRKPKFNSEQKEQIVAWTKEYPKKISLVKEKAKQNWNVSVSKDTIKRILKNENMSWRRIRKRVGRVRERPGRLWTREESHNPRNIKKKSKN
ncbi:MAG: helix-turn-helix domain-containing protein [Hormoscilla sp. GUM202]|nr:helix-turn-helix domain-containing protein [Hormoscilla sp. GUM202]